MDTPKDPADRIRSDDNTRLSDTTRAPTTTTSTQGDVSVATKGNNERRGTSVAVFVLAESSADADPSASGQSGLTGTPRHIGTTSTAQVVSTSSPAPAPTSPAVGSPVSTNVTPTIKLTPATPDTTHFASHRPTSTAPAPAAVNSDKMASTTTPAGGASSTTTTAKPTSTPASAPTATAGPSTTTTTPTSTAKGTKPKRKRTGFNKFLAAFGCLSAHDLEDDPATVAKREAALKRREKEKEAAAATPPSTAATKVASADARQVDGEGAQTEKDGAVVGTGAGTGGNTLSDASEAEKGVMGTGAGVQNGPTGEVVVPPSEPTSPPLAETAGLTSGAVQPPGSGAELLHQTPSKSSMHRRDSEASVRAGAVSPTGTCVNAGTVAAAGAGAGVVAGTETLQHEESDRSGDDSQDGDDEQDDQDMDHMYQYQDEYEEEDRLIAQGGMGIPTDELGRPAPLLPALDKAHIGRKCLVLDLDETLLHSSFKMLSSADYIVPVEIESQVHNVYVIKRPGVDKFLTEMGKIYEIVVFTASLSKYADPVLDMLDPNGVVKHRLFRESCYNHKGNYVKDLSQLGRTMETCIIIDNSPASYIFHPNNAVPVSTWFNDPHDTELTDLCPFLTDLSEVDDIRGVLDGSL